MCVIDLEADEVKNESFWILQWTDLSAVKLLQQGTV